MVMVVVVAAVMVEMVVPDDNGCKWCKPLVVVTAVMEEMVVPDDNGCKWCKPFLAVEVAYLISLVGRSPV
uniref:hypothetical protein n=1 Tax=Enterococcus faecalis TaxID=1351 RepID=UPI0028C47A04